MRRSRTGQNQAELGRNKQGQTGTCRNGRDGARRGGAQRGRKGTGEDRKGCRREDMEVRAEQGHSSLFSQDAVTFGQRMFPVSPR